MKKEELITLLSLLPDGTEIYVNAWSPEESYDRTNNIKICLLRRGTPEVIICDKNTEYWNNENLEFIKK